MTEDNSRCCAWDEGSVGRPTTRLIQLDNGGIRRKRWNQKPSGEIILCECPDSGGRTCSHIGWMTILVLSLMVGEVNVNAMAG